METTAATPAAEMESQCLQSHRSPTQEVARANDLDYQAYIPALCSATMKKIKAAHPSITTVTEFAAQTGIPIKDLLCSSRGGCSNFTLFGTCTEGCPYNHSTAPVPEGRQKDVNTQLIQGLKILDEKKKAASA